MDAQSQTTVEAADEVESFWNPLYSPCVPMVLRAAIELNVFKIIADSGIDSQLSLSEIASRIPTNHPKSLIVLENVLRFLIATSFLSASSRQSTSGDQLGRERTYGLTKESLNLLGHKTGIPLSIFIMFGTEREILESMYALKDAILDPERNSFGGKEAKNMFQLEQSNPQFFRLFNDMMSASSLITVNYVLNMYNGFNQMKELMDVAGGMGIGLTQIISAYPNIRGINFDLPKVISQAPKDPAITYVEGDMFQAVPKAENIWMKSILHDWDDERCEKLLKNCWEALPEGGRMIIVEYVMPEGLEDDHKAKEAVFMALHMKFMNLPGKERTQTEFYRLAAKSGFASTNFIPLGRGFFLMEFLKKPTPAME